MKSDFEIAEAFAAEYGFETVAEFSEKWNGYSVFSAINPSMPRSACCGCDGFILVKSGKARWTETKEEDDDETDEVRDWFVDNDIKVDLPWPE